jgi:tetratricopeptide (TPR) repeat protein
MTATGPPAWQACQSALVPGSEDEFAVLKRSGTLLQAANQPGAALDSYIAANLLKHDDRAIALSIVALSASTGRKDALTLAARGSALLTLGRALEALAPLRQALALSPEMPEAKAQLVRAERMARNEARRVVHAEQLAQEKERQQMAAAAADDAAREREAALPAPRYSNAAPATRSN